MMHVRTIGAALLLVTTSATCLTLARAQSTTCINNVCYTCNGTLSCSNDKCTCNGVPIEGGSGAGRELDRSQLDHQ
jgi:hypothetical protein